MNHAIGTRRRVRTRLAVIALGLSLAAGAAPFGTPVLAVEPEAESLVMTTELFRESGYNMHFGLDTAIEGDTMVVAGWTGDDNVLGNCGRGLAYVYERVDALEWREVAQLTYAEPIHCWTEDWGWTVAIHGDWIALGGPGAKILLPDADPVDPENSDYNHGQGAVLMFHKPEGGWQDATETLLLTEYDGSPGGEFGADYADNFGVEVAFEGEDLVVGAPNFDLGTEKDAGAVFVYREWLGGWERAAMLGSAAPLAGLHFGSSVDASEGAIAIGSQGSYYGGSYAEHGAWVFERPVDGWADSVEASASFAGPGMFAYWVSLDGPTLVALAPKERRVFVVERGLGGWDGALEAAAELDLPTVQYDKFSDIPWGNDVQGETIVIGAPYAVSEAGEAYVYTRPADGWGTPGEDSVVSATQILESPDPNQAEGVTTGDKFGWSVTVAPGIVAVGAYSRWHRTFDTGDVNRLAGSVLMFESSTDHEAPVTSFSFEPAEPTGLDGWYDEPLTLGIDASDDGSGVGRVRCALVTGGTFASYDRLPEGPCPYLTGANIPEGEWILFAASVDAAGNRGPVVSRVLKVDLTDPTAAIDLYPAEPSGPDGAWLPPLHVKINLADAGNYGASGWCTLDPVVAPTTYEELLALPFCGNDFFTGAGREYTVDESHTLWVAAIDQAGNTSDLVSATYSVVRRPRVSIALSSAEAPAGGWYRGPVTVTVTGTSASGQPAPDVRCALDPAVAPPRYDDLPASCPFAAGAPVTTSGTHVVYGASRDAGGTSPVGSATFRIDATPPTLTCAGTGPAQFVIGAPGGTLTATVADAGSGPSVASVSASLEAGDLDAAGSFTATVTATDVAGNVGTVACAYTVGYGIQIVSPTPGAGYKAGVTVPLTFRLVDADGDPIADATAASLLAVRKSPCRIVISLDDAAQRGCPTYTASTDLFAFGVKTPKSRSAIGGHDIGIEVRASNGSTVLGFARVAFQLT